MYPTARMAQCVRYPANAGTSSPDTHSLSARRNSTILNPRSYVTEELSKQAPVFTGSTKFAPLDDVRNILVTGGAGFMYVDSMVDVVKVVGCATHCLQTALDANAQAERAGSFAM